jgi:hypothetical protein
VVGAEPSVPDSNGVTVADLATTIDKQARAEAVANEFADADVAMLPSQKDHDMRAIDFAYSNLASSTNHKPRRESFRTLWEDRGLPADEFDAWAGDRVWWEQDGIADRSQIVSENVSEMRAELLIAEIDVEIRSHWVGGRLDTIKHLKACADELMALQAATRRLMRANNEMSQSMFFGGPDDDRAAWRLLAAEANAALDACRKLLPVKDDLAAAGKGL